MLKSFLVIFFGLLIFCISSISSSANEEPQLPQILDDQIVFINGSTQKIVKEKKELFTHYEDAHFAGLPSYYSQKAILIPSWKQVFLITYHYMYESIETVISAFGFSGSAIAPQAHFNGSFKILEKAKRLVIAPEFNDVVIYDNDRKEISTLKVRDNYMDGKYVFDIGVSADEELIWFYQADYIYEQIKKPTDEYPKHKFQYFTLITIVDHNGKPIKKVKSFKAESISFEFNEKTYQIKTETPRSIS